MPLMKIDGWYLIEEQMEGRVVGYWTGHKNGSTVGCGDSYWFLSPIRHDYKFECHGCRRELPTLIAATLKLLTM
jgi:hypothetical protein